MAKTKVNLRLKSLRLKLIQIRLLYKMVQKSKVKSTKLIKKLKKLSKS